MQRTKSIISGLQFLALASEMAESDRSGKRSESSAADFGGVEEKWFNFEPETNLCAVTVCKLLKEEGIPALPLPDVRHHHEAERQYDR